MLIEDLKQLLPKDWYPMDIYSRRYEIYEVPQTSPEFYDVRRKVLGNYYSDILGIYKLQNPHLYAKYILRAQEYSQRGHYEVLHLFHDTLSKNIESIAAFNIDWRHGERFMFGPGVYFSVSANLANKHSFKSSCPWRTMFVCSVLVQNVQKVTGHVFLPDSGYDTVLAHRENTYVKYFDSEFYPQYFVNYVKAY